MSAWTATRWNTMFRIREQLSACCRMQPSCSWQLYRAECVWGIIFTVWWTAHYFYKFGVSCISWNVADAQLLNLYTGPLKKQESAPSLTGFCTFESVCLSVLTQNNASNNGGWEQTQISDSLKVYFNISTAVLGPLQFIKGFINEDFKAWVHYWRQCIGAFGN